MKLLYFVNTKNASLSKSAKIWLLQTHESWGFFRFLENVFISLHCTVFEKGNKKCENNLFALNWNKMSLKEHKKSRVTGWNTNRLNTEHSENVSLGWGKDFEVFLLINTRFISRYLFFGFYKFGNINTIYYSVHALLIEFFNFIKTQYLFGF